jgi:hypothetical protein
MSRRRIAPSLPFEEYRSVVVELLESWDSFDGFDTRAKDVPLARVVFALVANAYRAGFAAKTLWDNDLLTESMPNVRACFESAVMAAWSQQTGNAGVEATMYERARHARNLMTTAVQAGITVTSELRDHIDDEAGRAPKPPKNAQARHFEKMCDDLELGDSLYLMYRQTSDAAHAPSALVRHLKAGPGDSLIPTKMPNASSGAASIAALTVAYSLIWAGRAFIEVGLHKPSKQTLRKTADRLGITSILVAKR